MKDKTNGNFRWNNIIIECKSVSTDFFFRAQLHKNTPFPPRKRCLFLFRCARSQGGLHIKKTQFLPEFRRFCLSEFSPLEASCPILILLTMEASPNPPPMMEGLIPASAPTDDMDGTPLLKPRV